MNNIINFIKQHFDSKFEYIQIFTENDVRVEGWFKGELLYLFTQMKTQGLITDFEREKNIHVGNKRFQVDFSVTIGENENLIELKTLSIGQRKGTPRNLAFYFKDDNLGLKKDVKKFNILSTYNSKWLLAFVYPKPDIATWHDLVSANSFVVSTNITTFNDDYFIALIKCQNNPNGT